MEINQDNAKKTLRNAATFAKIYEFYEKEELCDVILIAAQDGTR